MSLIRQWQCKMDVENVDQEENMENPLDEDIFQDTLVLRNKKMITEHIKDDFAKFKPKRRAAIIVTKNFQSLDKREHS